jgi:phosphatidate cytidylyltransferase
VSPFWQRTLISATLGPLGLFLIYLGGWAYFLPIFLILIIAAHEYCKMMAAMGRHAPTWLVVLPSLPLWIGAQFPEFTLQEPILFVGLFVVMGYTLWRYERRAGTDVALDWLVVMGGILLLGWVGGHFFRLRILEPEQLFGWTGLTLMATWGADSTAFLIGRRFGRHKLAPRLSPKKSYEGYLAGILVGTLLVTLVALAIPSVNPLLALVMGLLTTALGPAGDLGISLLKREAGVKDSGAIFPGHGGALDRIDSLMWSAAIGYYLLLLAG